MAKGSKGIPRVCPKCKSRQIGASSNGFPEMKCFNRNCGHTWIVQSERKGV